MLRMTASLWLALAVAFCWLTLLSPTALPQAGNSTFDGFDLPATVGSFDRHSFWNASERRRLAASDHDDPPAPTPAAPARTEFLVAPVARVATIVERHDEQPTRSPAQPRAPPEENGARED
jgi:hypothetical protein